jgi:hypothetical protein
MRLHHLSCTVLGQFSLFAFSDKRRNDFRALVSDWGSENLARDNDFDTAVFLATLSCAVVGHWVVLAKTLRQ